MQTETKAKIEYIIDHLEDIGIIFREAYTSLFKLIHASRLLTGHAIKSDKYSPLFNGVLLEESYQSGIIPTRTSLGLDEWFLPNDADVQACMFLCRHIDVLTDLGFLVKPKDSTDHFFNPLFKMPDSNS